MEQHVRVMRRQRMSPPLSAVNAAFMRLWPHPGAGRNRASVLPLLTCRRSANASCWISMTAAGSFALPNRTTATYFRTSSGCFIVFTASTRWMAKAAPRFIHSGTNKELLQTFGLTPNAIAKTIKEKLNG